MKVCHGLVSADVASWAATLVALWIRQAIWSSRIGNALWAHGGGRRPRAASKIVPALARVQTGLSYPSPLLRSNRVGENAERNAVSWAVIAVLHRWWELALHSMPAADVLEGLPSYRSIWRRVHTPSVVVRAPTAAARRFPDALDTANAARGADSTAPSTKDGASNQSMPSPATK